jgi:hypothetical protein
MHIRLIAVLILTMIFVPASVMLADESDSDNPVLMTYATPELAPDLFREKHRQVAEDSFCGACTTSDACGSGWVCCSEGCSDGLKKCYNVVSCDKVADETGSLKLFASR